MKPGSGTSTILLVLVLASVFIPAASAQGGQEEKCLAFFYSPSCPHCDAVERYLDDARQDHDIKVEKYAASEEPEKFARYLEEFEVPPNRRGAVPAVFIDGEYAVGSENSIGLLERKFNQEGTIECPLTDEKSSPATVAGITGLALVDAVNPCALVVLLILLTSILSRRPERKTEALKAGMGFSAAIFGAYFAMGVLIVLGFKSVVSVTQIDIQGLYQLMGAFAVVVGLLNMKDWISHGWGGFAMEVPFSWRPKMKKIIKSATSARGALVAGVIVSLFLLPCTSGPYFVAGGLLSGYSWAAALPWLLLYNAVFIAPMVAITLAVYGGFASVENVSDWREENIERLHLFAGIILVALGLALLLGLV